MMLRILFLLPLLTACISTIDLPLQSQHVMRPRAKTDSRVSLQLGQLETPDMTNTLDEVRDARGKVTNPTDENQLFGNEMETEAYFDIGFEAPENLAFGISSGRGLYVLYDYYNEGELTLSATASYASRSERKSDTDQLISEDEPKTTTKVGRQSTSSLAQMVSYKIPISAASAFIPYLSLGANHTHNVLKANAAKAESTKVLPSLVAGMYLKLRWFQIDLEEGLVFAYKERGEKSRAQSTHARTLGINFSF